MHVALVSTRGRAPWTRLTVGSVRAVAPHAEVHVLDVDGGHDDDVAVRRYTPQDVGLDLADLRADALALDATGLCDALAPALVRAVAGGRDEVVLVLHPGVVLVADPAPVVTAAAGTGLAVLPRTPGPLPADGRVPAPAALAEHGAHATAVVAVRGDRASALATWEAEARRPDAHTGRWLDVVAATEPHASLRPGDLLLTWWNLTPEPAVTGTATALRRGGTQVVALDLSGLDPAEPALWDARRDGDPRARLSAHPALVPVVQDAARRLEEQAARPTADGGWDVRRTSLGTDVDDVLRAALDDPAAPDPYDPAARDALRDWLTAPGPGGGPGRWLQALRRSRADLVAAFPSVPGADDAAFLAWARANATAEGYPAVLAVPPATVGRPPVTTPRRRVPGIDVVGFLGGSLGIGESARLLVEAARAASIPVGTVALTRDASGRVQAGARPDELHDTTVLCVNADYTPVVSETFPELVDGSLRIGMWYWEVEDFPATLHGAFAFVDEVWVATEFVRAALAPDSPVPVRVVCPPLPQRGPAPTLRRADLGLPDRPFHLFVFDYLSTAERKNPLGVVDAFTRAFGPEDGPVLVVKSINAAQRPAAAERLRLHAARHPHVLLLEEHLPRDARDALVAHCDAYVSLHRSEGLGLTIAEAMAWGKPVVATAYGGNVDFMTEANSFPVPWTPGTIPAAAAPYPAGGRWAEPDLDAAAALLRRMHDDPAEARRRGERAAHDLRERFGAAAAGERVRHRLDELADARRRRARPAAGDPLRTLRRILPGRG